MPNETNQIDIDKLRNFLEYGPIGFAGLMLLLVILALFIRRLSAAEERLLKLFMIIGAFCFTTALVAQHFAVKGEHTVQLTFSPHDFEVGFARPKVRVKGVFLQDNNQSFQIKDYTEIIVHFDDATRQFAALSTRAEKAVQQVAEALDLASKIEAHVSSAQLRWYDSDGASVVAAAPWNTAAVTASANNEAAPPSWDSIERTSQNVLNDARTLREILSR